jgi:hypothetical protein
MHFDDMTDLKSQEVLMSNRLIKNEVVDMADVIEKMSDVVLFQNKKIDNLSMMV